MRLRDVQRETQRIAANLQNSRAVFMSFLNETLEYSKRNPAVDPILEGAGLKPKAGVATSPTKPAGK